MAYWCSLCHTESELQMLLADHAARRRQPVLVAAGDPAIAEWAGAGDGSSSRRFTPQSIKVCARATAFRGLQVFIHCRSINPG